MIRLFYRIERIYHLIYSDVFTGYDVPKSLFQFCCCRLGGQKSRVAFAKITFNKPHILLLDEPSNHLDLDAVEALIQGLALFQGGVLMVSHDEHLISGSVDELWCVSEGKATPFHGSFADYKKTLRV